MLKVLCRVWCESFVICSPYHPMFLSIFRYIYFFVANWIRPPPSFGFWFNTLHMWLAIKPREDPPFPLCPWWGNCLGCFCVHCERCKIVFSIVRGAKLFSVSKPMFFHCLSFILLVSKLTLLSLMAFAHWSMLSLLIPFKQTWYHGQLFLMGWL